MPLFINKIVNIAIKQRGKKPPNCLLEFVPDAFASVHFVRFIQLFTNANFFACKPNKFLLRPPPTPPSQKRGIFCPFSKLFANYLLNNHSAIRNTNSLSKVSNWLNDPILTKLTIFFAQLFSIPCFFCASLVQLDKLENYLYRILLTRILGLFWFV